MPFEMVDAALEETRTLQQRLRDLPSRVVVYLLLAGCLFPEVGYLQVWRKLTTGLEAGPVTGSPPVVPALSASALGQDWEVELAAVVVQPLAGVDPDAALAGVFGYAAFK